MKKIVIVVPYLSGKGGTETVLQEVISNNPNRYSLYMVAHSHDINWLEDTGLSKNEYKVGKANQNKIIRYFNLLYFILKRKPSLVVAFDTKLILFLHYIRAILNFKFKIVSWIHYSLRNNPLVNPYWLKYADYHLSIADGITKQFLDMGIAKEKVFTIYNPVCKKNRIIPGTRNNNKYIYIGRIQYRGQKNLHDLFLALSKLKFKWTLDIYGEGSFDDKKLCRNYAAKLNILDNITWHGFIKEPFKNIYNADALLLSSKFEGLPMVVLEALSYGIPCISSNCQGPSEIVLNGKNGYLYKANNIKDFEEKISLFHKYGVENNKRQIQQTILKFYEQNYFERLDNVFQKLDSL